MKRRNMVRVRDPPTHKVSEGRRNFVRKVEDFVCQKCGERVIGDGYTDHCPKCLWGKHADWKVSGDRASNCKGLMKPMGVMYEKGRFKISYKCQKCGYEFAVRAAAAGGYGGRRKGKNDDREKLMGLISPWLGRP